MNAKNLKKSRALKFVLPLFVCICVMLSSVVFCFAWDENVLTVPYTQTANQNTFYHLNGLPDGMYEASHTGSWKIRGLSGGGSAEWSQDLSSSDVVILTVASSGWSASINGIDAASYASYDFQASSGTISIVEYVPPTPTPGPMDRILGDVIDTADTSINIGGTIISFIMSNPLALLGIVSWITVLLITIISKFFKN